VACLGMGRSKIQGGEMEAIIFAFIAGVNFSAIIFQIVFLASGYSKWVLLGTFFSLTWLLCSSVAVLASLQ